MRPTTFAEMPQVWAIHEPALHALLAAAAHADEAVVGTLAAAQQSQREGSTAVIPIRGVITRRPTLMSLFFGLRGGSVQEISDQLRAALTDRSVGSIVLNIDSPGGSVDGIPELADEIYAARKQKPITALVDTTAASAAYWLASQASRIVVTPSGAVGSIGVYGLHIDQSRALDAAGITPTLIISTGSPHKVEENPLQPLSDDARASIQTRVDTFYGMFARDVARGRGVPVEQVRSNFGQGRMVLAADAVKHGMADAIADAVPSATAHADASHRAEVRASYLRHVRRELSLAS